MKSVYQGVIVSAAAALATALVLAPVPMRGQLSEKDKAFKAKQLAKAFENNATVLTFYDRTGKQVGEAFGERALYGAAVLSPDRMRVALVKTDLDNESGDLYVLEIASGKSTRLTTSKRTEFIQSAVWSPDGKQLAYVQIRDGKEGVYRRSADGTGEEELLYKNPSAFLDLSDWSLDGRYLSFSKSDLSGGTLYVMPVAGEGAREPREIFHSEMPLGSPRFSPDGKYLSYLQQNIQLQKGEVFVRPVEGSGGPWQISDGARSPGFWRNDGKELYYGNLQANVMVAKVNTSPTFTFTKPEVLLRPPNGVPLNVRDLSRDGERFLVLPPPRGPQVQQITIFDRNGKEVSKVGEPGLYQGPAFSPDGKSVAVMKTDLKTGSRLIWKMDIATGQAVAINDDTHPALGHMWSPDGKYILYVGIRGSGTALALGVYRKPADGTGTEELLFQYTAGAGIQLTDMSPDGKYLLCDSGGVLLVVPLTGTDPVARKAVEFSRGEFDETVGRFSPDGKFIAYRSDEANALKGEVYVRPFDAATGKPGDGKWQVSKDGVNAMIHWRADGKEIFFRGLNIETNDLVVMSAEITTPEGAQGFQSAPPKVLFKLPGPLNGNLQNISRDGQRFVFAVNVPAGK
ncbi:MAG: PD40 domain-containing protein [Bryobacterales bacterium]|nr:PD40 domain-containing protein [Bryobacterales bacterium]MBV9399609.1 PD40 domain-containing protein [Bryobacterales bacterium]